MIVTSITGNRSVAYSGVVLVGASVVLGALMLTSSPASSAAPQLSVHATTARGDMAGMDHGSGDMPGMDHGSGSTATSSPSPTMAGDMAGMDHGSGGMPTSSPSPTSSADSPWKTHDHSDTGSHEHGASAKAANRPLAPVLGTFGGGTAAVMLSAGFLRRRDRAQRQTKQAAREARRSQK